MSSILTNNGAMVALQTLKSINKGLAETQNTISTGKKVSSAKDNAAVFAISKVMEADVSGFKAVKEGLALGQSTVAVASNGAKQIGELLSEIKGKIVSANEDNVDRAALDAEVDSLKEQITSIVQASQFNGLNLLDGSSNGANGFSVLSSLNRDSNGTVSTGSISFDPSNTSLAAASGTALTVSTAGDNAVVAGSVFTATDIAAGAAIGAVAGGEFSVTLTAQDGATSDTDGVIIGGFDFQTTAAVTAGGNAVSNTTAFDTSDATGLIAGDTITITIDDVEASYTISTGDSQADVATGLNDALTKGGVNTSDVRVQTGVNADGAFLSVENLTNRTDIDVTASASRGAGGLSGLDNLDVSTEANAAQALQDIEGFIKTTVDAQAQLGTVSKRLEIQSDFISTQIDSFTSGIGALVDADMEEVSARLQALQVQQQLGVQSLSIANQAPQTILSLFR